MPDGEVAARERAKNEVKSTSTVPRVWAEGQRGDREHINSPIKISLNAQLSYIGRLMPIDVECLLKVFFAGEEVYVAPRHTFYSSYNLSLSLFLSFADL